MSLGHGAKIVTDGLVFAYDMGNDKKSWKGKPTTNTVSTYGINASWNNSGTCTFTNNDQSITRLFPDIQVNSGEQTTDGNSMTGTGHSLISNNNTYTASTYVYIPSSAGVMVGSAPYFRSFPANTNRGTLSYNGNGDWNNWPRDQWIRIEKTWTNTAADTSMYISTYTNTTGNKIYFTAPQVEQNDFVTPFVNGTRSNTEAILDWTGNNTITANSLTYNSDGSFEFDGSSNYLTAQSIFPTTSDFTISVLFSTDNVGRNTTENLFANGSTGTSDIILLYPNTSYGTASNQIRLYQNGEVCIGSDIRNTGMRYITLTKENNLYTIYLEDTIDCSGTSSTAIEQTLWIGNSPYSSDRAFMGNIPIIKIYNKALTPEEVKQNFNTIRGRYGL